MKNSDSRLTFPSLSFIFLLRGYHFVSECFDTLICGLNFGLCFMGDPRQWATTP